MAISCNEINQMAAELKMKFEAKTVLLAEDMDLLVDLALAIQTCSGEVINIDSAHYKLPIETILDLTLLNYVNLVDEERHYVKEANIEYIWDATATEGDYEPIDKGYNVQGFWKKLSYTTFSESLEKRLIDSVYLPLTQYISLKSSSSFEKGTQPTFIYKWKVTKNDNTLISVDISGNSVINDADGTEQDIVINSLNPQSVNKTLTLTSVSTLNTVEEGTQTEVDSVTSYARIPQYYGLVDDADTPPLTYALLNPSDTTKLKKFISSSSIRTVELGSDLPIPSNEKLFFLSTNSNAIIRDANGFKATSAFEKTTVTMELESGTQEITQYILIDSVSSGGSYTITTS